MKHIVFDARIRRSSTGRYMDRLLEHLQEIDDTNRYTVILKMDDDWQPTNKNFSAVHAKYRPYSFNILDQITFALFLYKLKPDLVHFTITPQEPIFYLGRRVNTTHDLTMFHYARSGKLPKWLHALRMLGYRFNFWWSHIMAKRVIVISQYVADSLTKLYPFTRKKITVTLEASEPPLQASAKILKGVKQPFIFHVGSPLPHKNIDRLVEAFTSLKNNYPDLQLVLVGKKEQYFDKLEQSVQNNPVKDSIIMPGFVPDTQLKWLYQNAEAYVLPSLSEGFGLPGLEAMAHGCPLVSSNATCLPEIYGNAAEYFDPENTDDMITKIASVLDSPSSRKALIQKGYAQIKKYSWRRMAEQTLEVYKKALR